MSWSRKISTVLIVYRVVSSSHFALKYWSFCNLKSWTCVVAAHEPGLPYAGSNSPRVSQKSSEAAALVRVWSSRTSILLDCEVFVCIGAALLTTAVVSGQHSFIVYSPVMSGYPVTENPGVDEVGDKGQSTWRRRSLTFTVRCFSSICLMDKVADCVPQNRTPPSFLVATDVSISFLFLGLTEPPLDTIIVGPKSSRNSCNSASVLIKLQVNSQQIAHCSCTGTHYYVLPCLLENSTDAAHRDIVPDERGQGRWQCQMQQPTLGSLK